MSSFEDAARRLLDAPADANVTSTWFDGSNDGCYTCGHGDTPGTIEISAGAWVDGEYKFYSREFTDLPALWDALFTDDEKESDA